MWIFSTEFFRELGKEELRTGVWAYQKWEREEGYLGEVAGSGAKVSAVSAEFTEVLFCRIYRAMF